uniref:Uncharacterized protein n=1 Tax=Myoviridae sp. ctrMq22 TaxID=2825181 RepID=A0A8S5NUT3_9CAUD|nr:MAG TPA: hypothetical protein [Myoviridae sp. ctrMq22]
MIKAIREARLKWKMDIKNTLYSCSNTDRSQVNQIQLLAALNAF